ncbi:rho guanine nucleotide exchange factor 28-like isoform X1 [Megalops cyprinoides]|uniref:rho guanine nucleotide exchange factor 28-like isoform X1 n=1 Tax=Megalops cyprinoides TaxID=118141 RepID=UPI0018654520|nr:rho guanine nucleotide exchange factor 28-like isoform X1 [Megalops cyprinoides]
MELSRREVPLYGQVKVCAVLQTPELVPEDAEVYIVLGGSTLDHITAAQRTSNGSMLTFVVPGHNLLEEVTVTAYLHTEEGPVSCLKKTTLEYVQDDAQELSEFLVTHCDCLSASGSQDILSRFGLGDEATRAKMDKNVAQAMANLDYPYTWNVLGSRPGEVLRPRESLLHLAVRLGFLCLSELLLCQPGGLMAVTMPNEEGDTPLQLAERSGERALLELLTDPPNPLVTPLAGVSQVWADSSRLLRFFHGLETLTLTARRTPERNQQVDILLLRKSLRDDNFLREIKALKRSASKNEHKKEVTEGCTNNTGLNKDIWGEDHGLVDSVFEEQLILSVEEEEEPSPLETEKNLSASLSTPPVQSTFTAAARLSALLNGKEQVYANAMLVDQVDDLDIKYSIAGVTGDSSVTESTGSDAMRESPPDLPARFPEAGPSCSRASPALAEGWEARGATPDREQSPPAPSFPPPSPPNLELARLNQPPLTGPFSQGGSPPRETCALSPSLVALEVDSEEEDLLGKAILSHVPTSPKSGSVLQASSGDEQDSFDTSPDLSSSRTHSSSSYNPPPTKELGDPGIRLRSYSYSSPKLSLVRPRFARDATIPDLSEEQRSLNLSEHPKEKREIRFRKRAQSAEDEGSAALADSLQHLTLSEFLKEIEDEEWDKYIIPSKAESEKYKVSRTFSFLKSRMSSTRNKNKAKGKEKEGKEKTMNGHQFVAGTCSGLTLCLVCDKPAVGKELLQCSNCTINVHKGCRDSAATCMKKPQEKYAVMMKNKTASLPQSLTVRESPPTCLIQSSVSLPTMTSRDRREPSVPLSKSLSITDRRPSDGVVVDTESAAWRNGSQSDEVMESLLSTDSFMMEDTVDAPLRSDLRADLLDYEAESWSLAVDHKFCKKHDKRVIKRQDVIYELMQTEMHHIQTLTIMAEIFRKGMKEELQLDHYTVDKIFPCLDELFDFHKSFFCAMKERRQSCTREDNSRNFRIDRIGDILVQQFSDDNAAKMKQVYGEFCSHHTEAVSFFKELQQQNKKFQAFIKQQSNNSLVRRREIPECILLVTQRITKYPVLLERILQHSEGGTEEHTDLTRALALIRDVIAAVDLKVNEYEKEQKLLEILNRMENKSFTKLKNGHTFRKQDLQARTLKHEGLVFWKTATGRLKDILALLLTDALIFLQEKDQKYVFAAVDQKPPVISLQKLIVREVANEERGMFLISASAAGPEMYEVHMASKEERNSWMRLIREAVESCPEEEEERTSESEEDRRAAEARAHKIQRLQETLNLQDQQICTGLEEKLKIYAELTGVSVNEEALPVAHLLVRPDSEDVPQATALLNSALREVETLTTTLTSLFGSSPNMSQESLAEPSSPVKLSNHSSFSSIQESPTESDCLNTQSSSSVSDCETREVECTEAFILQALTELKRGDVNSINLKVAHSVQSLTQLLYSLQAAVTIQDSCYEVQKLLLQESERLPRPPCPRGSALQEQEKQRNLERRREELAGVQRLQGQLRQEQQRWERECDARQRQQGELEGRLERRERECRLEAQRLRREREELDGQLREYQQSLERLREGQRLVERERQRLETQQRLLQSWRHSRQSSLPVMVIPLDEQQDPSHGRSGSLDSDRLAFMNEGNFQGLQTSLNNHHLHQLLGHHGAASAQNSLNALIACTNSQQANQGTDASHHHQNNHRTGTAMNPLPEFVCGTAVGQGREHTDHDFDTRSYNNERSSAEEATGVGGAYQWFTSPSATSPLLTPQAYLPLEAENGEDRGEENIVYL